MTDGRRSEVILLDDRRVELIIQPKLFAGDLFDIVSSHFNLKEKEYFGLAFLNETGQYSWLNLDKRVLEHEYAKKNSKDKLTLHFLVKYFVDSITQLSDTASVELFYLQAKLLVQNEVIQVDPETAFLLAALVLQASFGDDGESTLKTQLKKLQLIPSYISKEHPITFCQEKVLEHYKSLKGQSRGEAIVKYMSIIEKQPTYGVHFYEIKDKAGIPWWLGLSYKGISQFDYNDRRVPRRNFLWKQLENLYFRERKFSIEVRDPKRVVHTLSSINLYENAIEESLDTFDDLSTAISDPTTQVSVSRRTFGPGNVTVYVWFAENAALTKCIWSMAIAQHQFYIDKRNLSKHQVQPPRTLQEIAFDLNRQTSSLISSRSSKFQLNRSISSHSLPALRIEEDSISQIENIKAEKQKEMFETLKVRREALEEALNKKLAELKALCLKEGELTGELPPETPLAPGEAVPQIRRRVGTAFTLNDKLLLKPKSKEEEILSKLELEYEIQSKIVSAAAKLVNESATKKNVRRQRKQAYQQALAKMKDLEAKLVSVKKQIAAANLAKSKRQPSFEDLSEDNMSHSTDESQEKSVSEFNAPDQLLNNDKHLSNSGLHRKRNLRELANQMAACRSLPPTPNKWFDKQSHMRPISPTITSFIPITMRARILHRPRSASAKFDRSSHEDEFKDYHCEAHNDVFASKPKPDEFNDGSSICSSSSGTNRSVIHIHRDNDKAQELLLQSPYVNKYESSVNFEGSNLYSVPNRRISIALQSQDDGSLRCRNTTKVVNNLIQNNSIEEQSLARSNSLENTRRKAVGSNDQKPVNDTHHHHYQNHHPSFRNSRSCNPKSPPPYCNLNIAQRPLPSPPVSKSDSKESHQHLTSSSTAVNYANVLEKTSESPTQIYASIPDDEVDHPKENCPTYYNTKLDESHVEPLLRNNLMPSHFSRNSPSSASLNSESFKESACNFPVPQVKAKTWTESCLDVVLPAKATYSIIQKTPNKQHMHHHHHQHHIPPHSRPPMSSNMLKTHENDENDVNVVVQGNDAKECEHSSADQSITPNVNASVATNSALSPTRTSFQSSTKTAIPFAIPIAPALSGVEVNVVSVGHIQPYWEEEKPFEMSDFYKYSSKHRKQMIKANSKDSTDSAVSLTSTCQSISSDMSNANINSIVQSDSSVSLNDSLGDAKNKSSVIGSFHDELLAWYDDQDNNKNATLV